MQSSDRLPYTVTKDFSRDCHLYCSASKGFSRIRKIHKQKAHRAERRTTRLELLAGKEPQLRHQITGWEVC